MKEIILKILSVFLTFPKPNEHWTLRDKADDPWIEHVSLVTILDVKKGWVRYKIGDGSLYPDERNPISIFIFVYQKVREEK